jgi:hypothetical protein
MGRLGALAQSVADACSVIGNRTFPCAIMLPVRMPLQTTASSLVPWHEAADCCDATTWSQTERADMGRRRGRSALGAHDPHRTTERTKSCIAQVLTWSLSSGML